jgi:hypothetical protein
MLEYSEVRLEFFEPGLNFFQSCVGQTNDSGVRLEITGGHTKSGAYEELN